jgi:signal peptidase I
MEENNRDINAVEVPVQNKGFKNFFPFVLELAKIALIALVIVAPIRYFLFQPFIVKGESMAPNFENGDYLIVDEISYRFSDPERGDVIVFNYPKQPSEKFIKRIIGLPGETIEISGGQIKIDKGEQSFILGEKYLPNSLETEGDVKITLKDDQYFVLGDNREYSFDSRVWGAVPRKNIIGKAFLRILPLAALSQIAQPSY